MKLTRILVNCLLACGVTAGLSSCLSHKEMINFAEGTEFPAAAANGGGLRLQPEDIVSIAVFSANDIDKSTIAPYNLSVSVNAVNDQSPLVNTYRVDETGAITFPGLGQVPVAGLTMAQTRDTLVKGLKKYLNEPIVNIRLTNFRVTVLGEVRSPGTFQVPTQQITILEALGLAGDFTNYGRRDNILVIREINGQRTTTRLNLKDKSVFASPYFYLKQNDFVYVEPLKQKTGSVSDQTSKVLPWVSLGTVVLNLLIILAK